MKRIECNLCLLSFPIDDLEKKRKKTHERWHTNCRKEKRNTTEGKVTWRIINLD